MDRCRIAIVGSTSMAERLIYYFESTGFGDVAGMLDDFEETGTIKHDRPVLGKIANIPELLRKAAFDSVAIGIGYRQRQFRQRVYEYLKQQEIPVTTFVHPSTHVETSAHVGEGSIILRGCTIDMKARLEENVLLGTACYVGHDVRIRAHTYCGPRASLAGFSEVGECCFVGIGTTIIDGVKIGNNVQTAAGAVITRDVPSDVMVAGVPAVIKKRVDGDGG